MADTDPKAVHLQTAAAPVGIVPEQGSAAITGTMQAAGFITNPTGTGPGIKYRPNILIPDGALDAWYAAKKTALQGGVVPVCYIGDSIAQGFKASSWQTTSCWALVKAALQTAYGDAGVYYPLSESALYAGGGNIPAADIMWTAVANNSPFSMNGYGCRYTAAINDAFTFAPQSLTFPDFDLVTAQEPGGCTLSVTVDTVLQGGAPTCLNAAITRRAVFPYNGFGATTHTVLVKATSAAVCVLSGVTAYTSGRGRRGILMVKECMQGASAWNTFLPRYPVSFPTYRPAAAHVEDWAPKLAIISFGINDCQQYGGLSFMRALYAQALQSAQDAGCSIVMVIPYGGTGLTNFRGWGVYVDELYGLAAAFGAVVINGHTAFGTPQSAATMMDADNIHWNDTGHAFMANQILSVL